MNKLTPREQKVLNNVSRVISKNVSLGDRIQEIISGIVVKGSAVNAIPATGVLTISGAVAHGESITINNPLEDGTDVYVFDASGDEDPVIAGTIVVDISDYTTAANETLTVDVQPTATDTFTIGTKTYKFVAKGSEKDDGDVSVGDDVAGAQAAIVAAINGTDEINKPHPLVSASDFTSDVSTITARVGGTAANSIATTETFTAVTNVFGGETLSSGLDCANTNAVTAVAAAVTEHGTQLVSATAGTGVVNFAANIGIAGNNIETTEDMANGAFGTATLQNGASGTPAPFGSMMLDNTYLYIAIANNTLGDANWRRIAIGSTF